MRSHVPAPSPVVRGDLDGYCVYLEATGDELRPGQPTDTFPTSPSAYEAVKAAREVPAMLAHYFKRMA